MAQMSREIKFRAWNSVTKEMEQVTQINLKNHYVQTTFNKIGYSYGQPDDVIVEQYTGLKDKNGKDIYEGDLLKVKIEDSWQATPFLVKNVWDPHVWINESDPYYAVREMVVIGDVHRNPELLEDD